MRIGLTFDLKEDHAVQPGQPDDLQEEFDSPVTVEGIARVLRGLGHDVVMLGDGREFLQRLLADPPDFVFNIAEGQGVGRSREARAPAALEMLGIPHSGSDPLTLAVTLDKAMAKTVVAAAGVPVPRGVVIEPEWQMANGKYRIDNLQFPVIVKPAWEGSSKGIRQRCIVHDAEDLPGVVEALRSDYGQPILVEEYIQGEELTVGVLGNSPPRVLGVMQVLPTRPDGEFIYSLEVKRDYERLVRYECPPQLPAAIVQRIENAALTCYRALGCRDVARVDFRLRDGVPYFLEVNPLPGLNPLHSDLVIMARLVGWSYERLIGTILAEALGRYARK
jgi:D-alanine-D-alanine ligase